MLNTPGAYIYAPGVFNMIILFDINPLFAYR